MGGVSTQTHNTSSRSCCQLRGVRNPAGETLGAGRKSRSDQNNGNSIKQGNGSLVREEQAVLLNMKCVCSLGGNAHKTCFWTKQWTTKGGLTCQSSPTPCLPTTTTITTNLIPASSPVMAAWNSTAQTSQPSIQGRVG